MWRFAGGFVFGSLVTYLLVGNIDVKRTVDNAVNKVKECIVPKETAVPEGAEAQ